MHFFKAFSSEQQGCQMVYFRYNRNSSNPSLSNSSSSNFEKLQFVELQFVEWGNSSNGAIRRMGQFVEWGNSSNFYNIKPTLI
jgi:hypothetical protein